MMNAPGGRRAALETKDGLSMKARLYRLATTVAMLAVVIEALGAGRKW
jgi:hypothetical protein